MLEPDAHLAIVMNVIPLYDKIRNSKPGGRTEPVHVSKDLVVQHMYVRNDLPRQNTLSRTTMPSTFSMDNPCLRL